MTMAMKLAKCLSKNESRFETIPRTGRSLSAGVPLDRLARAVLLEDERGYLTAVIPSSHHLKLSELREQSGRKLSYAHMDGVREVFRDCDLHALPPVGMAYGTLTWIDDSLLAHDDVYFEAGDRELLVHMDVAGFSQLMGEARHGHFAHRVM